MRREVVKKIPWETLALELLLEQFDRALENLDSGPADRELP